MRLRRQRQEMNCTKGVGQDCQLLVHRGMLKSEVNTAKFGSHRQWLSQDPKRMAAEVESPIGMASMHMIVGRAGRAIIMPRWGRELEAITHRRVGWEENRVVQEGSRANKENAGSQCRRLIRAVVRSRTGWSYRSISRRYPPG